MIRYVIIVCFLCFSLMAAATRGQIPPDSILTLSNFDYVYPNWSPDGSQLAFTSDMLGGNSEIFTMNADGSHVTRLTFNKWDDLSPAWSPDGTKIAFGSIRKNGKHDVFVMEADGSIEKNITRSPNSHDNHPKFTPDGKKIVFNSSRDTPDDRPEDKYDYELYEINLDGSGLKRLTYFPGGWDSYPSVSPDGKRLLWRRILPVNGEERGNSEIFIANRDGSDARNISNHPAFDGYPAWSPDGSRIVFSSTRNRTQKSNPPGLYIMDPDGKNVTALTESSADKADVRPWFSPDGSYIVFNRICLREDRTDIIVIKISG